MWRWIIPEVEFCFLKTMLAHAQIDSNEALVIGMGNYIEIWNPEVFNRAF